MILLVKCCQVVGLSCLECVSDMSPGLKMTVLWLPCDFVFFMWPLCDFHVAEDHHNPTMSYTNHQYTKNLRGCYAKGQYQQTS